MKTLTPSQIEIIQKNVSQIQNDELIQLIEDIQGDEDNIEINVMKFLGEYPKQILMKIRLKLDFLQILLDELFVRFRGYHRYMIPS